MPPSIYQPPSENKVQIRLNKADLILGWGGIEEGISRASDVVASRAVHYHTA